MSIESKKIRDKCRINLVDYTIRAFSIIPEFEKPAILDLGCGTGVSTIALAENYDGKYFALDNDQECLDILNEKVIEKNLKQKVTIIKDSAINPLYIQRKFDVILAEGILNIIGFENGLEVILKYLKNSGYLLIHDDCNNVLEKGHLFKIHDLVIREQFRITEDIWWNEYYQCLERKIKEQLNANLFEDELNEIKRYKENPREFRSIIYMLQHKL